MRPFTVCKQIRRVSGGYVVDLRWPHGCEPSGFGEVVCTTWEDVLEKLTVAAIADDKEFKEGRPLPKRGDV